LRVTFGLCSAVGNISTMRPMCEALCGLPAARAGGTRAFVAITDNNYCRRHRIQDLRTYQETVCAGQNFQYRSFSLSHRMQHQRTVKYCRQAAART